jgi:hypothetical protein
VAAILEGTAAVGTVATAVGVWVAARQLKVSQREAVRAFETELTREYRSIVKELPAEAFL